jgi:GMP synthase-like glutamine amidotransferase
MKPVAIFRHAHSEGPGHFATYLERKSLGWKLLALDAGDAVPRDARAWSGLVFMGGPMSVNDDLPWINPVLDLIRDAVRKDVPVLGHCLGGQLMARALGAAVTASPAPEIGWQPLQVHAVAEAQAWFGDAGERQVFHWHSETFGLPPGAVWLARSPACPHQAFSIGPHLGMQFHIEIDEAKLRRGLDDGDPAWAQALTLHASSVQDKATILAQAKQRLQTHQRLADRLYGRWISEAALVSAS